MIRRASNHQAPSSVRCAIYTRKSTDEGLDMDFNSLDAQREAGEAYVASQKSQGWVCLDDRFDDGGFTGGNLDRPALKRLLAAVEAGRVDCIVIYKVDRLSRSLLDFTRLVELFDKHGVSLVSVTQPINTRDSAGRLMLNVLLSFAQFEREMVSDRTRDKMAASRRKGKWTGGRPVLGYDVVDKRLVINEAEAAMVREIFKLYLAAQSISEVVEEINCRGWVSKSCTTKTGQRLGGGPFTKNYINHLLANPIYVGRVRYQGEEFPGEHEAIVDERTFQRVQDLMARNAQTNGSQVRNKYGFLLKGLARCTACNAPLIPSVTRKGSRTYRYYVCGGAMKKGYRTCPCPQINAQKLEDVIVSQIRVIGQDRELQRETVRQVREIRAAKRPALLGEQKRLRTRLEKVRGQLHHLLDSLATGEHGAPVGARIADLEEQAGKIERRLTEIRQALAVLDAGTVDEADLAKALSMFTPIWEVLYPVEQARVIQLLIARIDHDAVNKKLAVTFAPSGIQALAGEVDSAKESTCVSS
jgi:site-specific DNA recombinase